MDDENKEFFKARELSQHEIVREFYEEEMQK